MGSNLLRATSPFITQARSQLAGHLRTTFFANAYALILNEVASAGLGVLYWLIAARAYSADVVGESSATISTLVFLASLSQLSLRSAMIRFVPRAGTGTRKLIAYTYGVCLMISAIISALFLSAVNHIPSIVGLTGENHFGSGWWILATIAWCIYFVQSGVLTGMRKALWVLVGSSIFNVAKIVLLVALLFVSADDGIVLSWFIPVPILLVLINVLIFYAFMPGHLKATAASASRVSVGEIATSVSFDYVGSLLAEMTARILPLLVLSLVGKSANAYFYQAWLVGSSLYLIASSMASSFTVEAAANISQIAVFSRRMLLHTARLVVPLTVLTFVAAPFCLSLFGEMYASEGSNLLRLLAVAALPVGFNTWYLCYARVTGAFKSIVVVQSLLCVVTLTLSYWWLPTYGITSIGTAWLIGQCAVSVIIAFRTIPLWFRSEALLTVAPGNPSVLTKLRLSEYEEESNHVARHRSTDEQV